MSANLMVVHESQCYRLAMFWLDRIRMGKNGDGVDVRNTSDSILQLMSCVTGHVDILVVRVLTCGHSDRSRGRPSGTGSWDMDTVTTWCRTSWLYGS